MAYLLALCFFAAWIRDTPFEALPPQATVRFCLNGLDSLLKETVLVALPMVLKACTGVNTPDSNSIVYVQTEQNAPRILEKRKLAVKILGKMLAIV